jgi:hypothetical protein
MDGAISDSDNMDIQGTYSVMFSGAVMCAKDRQWSHFNNFLKTPCCRRGTDYCAIDSVLREARGYQAAIRTKFLFSSIWRVNKTCSRVLPL